MALQTIDWLTPRNALCAFATTPAGGSAPDPWGAHAILGALESHGQAYDADVANVNRALAAGEIKPVAAQAAVLATPAATDWHAEHLTNADMLARIIAMANKVIAAPFPWSPSHRPPGLVVGSPWLHPGRSR